MSKTNESTKFCIRCPGKDRHLMSCPIHKGGKVKSWEPWHGEKFAKKNKTTKICDCCNVKDKIITK